MFREYELTDELESQKDAILAEAYARENSEGEICIECGDEFTGEDSNSIAFCCSTCKTNFYESENIREVQEGED